MNIIFLHSHNTGRHIQPYGYAVPTPNIQKLANEGILFRKAFAAAPTCSPSRAAFLTGQCPHSAGMLGLAHRGFGPINPEEHLVTTLKNNGYTTALCGVEHVAQGQSGRDECAGYDVVLPTEQSKAQEVAPLVCDFLKSQTDKPFFISVGLQETHEPWHEPDSVNHPAEDERHCAPPAPLPDTQRVRRDVAHYKAAARIMDECYGQILDTLAETGLDKETLVFCFADHGLQFPRHMCNLTDTGLEVYLVVRGPENGPASCFRGGAAVDALVSLIDLFPTVCESIGIERPQWLQGESLIPLVNGEADKLHDELFGEVTYHAAYEPTRSVRTERYKYIRRYDDREHQVLPNVDDGYSRDYLLEEGWNDLPRDREMLFDLVFDPFEAHNLIEDRNHQDTAADLRSRLDKWMKDTNDPMLAGHADPPSGALHNNPDSTSFRDEVLVQQ